MVTLLGWSLALEEKYSSDIGKKNFPAYFDSLVSNLKTKW